MKLEGIEFKNSEMCQGVAYSDENAAVDMSVIDIKGRYPESGWAVNEKVYEMTYVKKGTGSLTLKDAQVLALEEGSVVSVAPGNRFAWEGNMTIVMACNPPFDSAQYKLEDNNEV